VCLSKADLVPAAEDRESMCEQLAAAGVEAHWISAVTGEGIPRLLRRLAALAAQSTETEQTTE
jgi:50S ribosomal subunit-associated GTPase HflX